MRAASFRWHSLGQNLGAESPDPPHSGCRAGSAFDISEPVRQPSPCRTDTLPYSAMNARPARRNLLLVVATAVMASATGTFSSVTHASSVSPMVETVDS
jgi:hypothetical protein